MSREQDREFRNRLKAKIQSSPAAIKAARKERELINFILALKKTREAANLSQKELAEKLKVRQPQISKWEHIDTNNMTLRSMQDYLDAVDGELVLGVVTKDREYIPVTTKAIGWHSPNPTGRISYTYNHRPKERLSIKISVEVAANAQ